MRCISLTALFIFVGLPGTTVLASSFTSPDPATLVLDLQAADPLLRIKAAESLGKLGASAASALPPLMEALNDFTNYVSATDTRVVSVAAAHAIAQIDPHAVVSEKALARLVHSAAMPPIHRSGSGGGWVIHCAQQNEALETLAELGPQAGSVLTDILRLNRKPCVEDQAMETALAFGSPSAAQLSRLQATLSDNDPDVRRSVVQYLGAAHISSAMASLGRAMNDVSGEVRLTALSALEQLHPEGEARLPLLRPLLGDASSEVRRMALDFLVALMPESSAKRALLHDRLKDVEPSIVMESARALSRNTPNDRPMIEALTGLAKKTDSDSGIQAAELLKTIGASGAAVDEALAPYIERERRQILDKALISSTDAERTMNGKALEVVSIRVAQGIRGENPDRSARSFAAGTRRLFCWTRVSVDTAPASLRHLWFHKGKLVSEVSLVAPDSNSAVWSSRRVQPGPWRVEVRTPGSMEPIAAVTFTVH